MAEVRTKTLAWAVEREDSRPFLLTGVDARPLPKIPHPEVLFNLRLHESIVHVI